MKKEDLIALGIDEEVAKSVMSLHGKQVTQLNAQVATAEQQATQYHVQIQANQDELDSLKEAAKGNEELTKSYADLQAKFDASKSDADSKLSEAQKDYAIKLALKDANALDESIILGLLDRDTIKVADNGLQGLTEQLETLKTDKSFLFAQETPADPAKPQITVGGNPTGTVASVVNKESFDKMTFAEQSELAKTQPEVFNQITGGN